MKIVLNQILKLILPCLLLLIISFIIFYVAGFGTFNVAISFVLGYTYSLLNFFMLGTALAISLEKTNKIAFISMSSQYLIRYLLTGVLVYFAIKIEFFNVFAFVLPLFFPKITFILNALIKQGRRN